MTTPSELAWTVLRRDINLSALAEELGVTRAAVSAWRRVPARHVVRVAALIGTTPHRLRPDMLTSSRRGDPWASI